MKKLFLPFAGLVMCALVFARSAGAAEVRQEKNTLIIPADYFTISYSLERGVWDLVDHDGAMVVRKAESRVVLSPSLAGRPERVISSAQASSHRFSVRAVTDRLGGAVEVTIASERPGAPLLTTTFRTYAGRRFVVVSLAAEGFPEKWKKMRVKALEPIRVEGPSGGLFVGDDPVRAVVLENGSNLYLDFLADMYPLGQGPPFPARLISTGSKSDFSSIIFDRASGKSALAGFLEGPEAGQIWTDCNEARAGKDHGRRGISRYAARRQYRPPLPADQTYQSGAVYLDFFAATPFQSLADYGDAIAKWRDIKPWPGDIPTGWNSWGEYYSDINEEIVLENLDFAAQNFLPFGMKHFQMDSGYSPWWGDWEADPGRFPHGLEWLARRIEDKGMIPGIWMAPFNVDVHSKTYREHPDWVMRRKGIRDKLLTGLGEQNMMVLDLSKPEVIEHVREVVRRCVREYGFRWLKLDFTYQFLFYREAGDGRRSVPDYYAEAMRAIKEEAGPDVFVLGVGVTGFHYGLVDANRITLDNMPAWNNQSSWMFSGHGGVGFVQGLVPTARNVARRYWLNNRVWINHPDLIYFNNDRWPDWGPAPISFDEALCFAVMAGLSGGIIKIGDKPVDMTPREAGVIQRLLPVYPAAATPLDLFDKETPEIWDLKVKTNFENWDVVGLFNWGRNRENGREIPEATRRINSGFARMGLDPDGRYLVFDFWNENFLGIQQGAISLEIPPRQVRVLAVRKAAGHPWFLSSNRHFTQGGVEIENVAWDEDKKILTGRQKAVPGYDYRLFFHCPEGYALRGAEVDGIEARAAEQGGLITLSFTPDKKELAWRIRFNRTPG